MKLFWFFIFNDPQQRLQKYTIISSSRESDVQERLYRRFNNAMNNPFHRPPRNRQNLGFQTRNTPWVSERC